MQTGGVMQGANTIPRRSRPSALLAGAAVLAIAALAALMFWVGPLGSGGVETREAVPAAGAGTAVVHDDAGSVHTGLAPGYAAVHDDAGNVPTGLVSGYAPIRHDAGKAHPATGTAIVHDDAGNMPPPAGTAIVHDDAGNVNR